MGKKKTRKPGSAPKRRGQAARSSRSSERERDSVRELIVKLVDKEGSPHDVLHAVLAKTAAAGKHLAWLAAYDFDAEVSMAATALLANASHPGVPASIQERVWEAAEPVIMEALRNKSLSDERKALLAGVHMEFAGEFAPHELRSFFKDFEGVVHRSFDESVKGAAEEPEVLESMLYAGGLLGEDDDYVPPPEAFYSILAAGVEMGERRPAPGAAIIGAATAIAAGHGVPLEAVSPALEALRGNTSEQAAWTLRELGNLPATGRLGVLARLMAEQLEAEGIRPRPALRRTFVDGRVTIVDGNGWRSISLFFRTPGEGLDMVSIQFSDTDGIRDVWGVFDRDLQPDEMAMFDQSAFLCTGCSLEFARELLADVLAIHEQLDEPVPARYFIYRPYLGCEPITPQRRTPDLSAYRLEDLEHSPKLVEGSAALVEDPPYAMFWCASDEAYQFVTTNLGRFLDTHARGARITAADEKRFIREVALHERDTLLSRMAANLELQAMAGRADYPANRLAARTWLAIKEDVVPFDKVPYIRLLARIALESIVVNLRHGFRSQEEANEAALHDHVDDMIEELLGDEEQDEEED